MSKIKYRCPRCDEPVLKARWEGGRQYCTSSRCIEVLSTKSSEILYERPPQPGERTDISPYELEDVEMMYGYEMDDGGLTSY